MEEVRRTYAVSKPPRTRSNACRNAWSSNTTCPSSSKRKGPVANPADVDARQSRARGTNAQRQDPRGVRFRQLSAKHELCGGRVGSDDKHGDDNAHRL